MTESHNGPSSSAESDENPLTIPKMKYKLPRNAVIALDKARKAMILNHELTKEQVNQIEEDLNWLVEEHREEFSSEKRKEIKKGLSNLKEDSSLSTALGVVKMVRREFSGFELLNMEESEIEGVEK
jgi:hypothetical protein